MLNINSLWQSIKHVKRKSKLLFIVLLLLLWSSVLFLQNKPTPEETKQALIHDVEKNNRKLEKKITRSMTLKGKPSIYDPQVKVVGDFVLLIWPNKPGDFNITSSTDILKIPKSFFKEDKNGSSKVFLQGMDRLSSVNIRIQLPYMEPWNPPPPLRPQEAASIAGFLRQYPPPPMSLKWLFGWNDAEVAAVKEQPESMDDPKFPKYLENSRQRKRLNKVVNINRGKQTSPITINIPEKIPDGKVGVLNGYSQVECAKQLLQYPSSAENDSARAYRIRHNERIQKILANKPVDDPAPEGCWVDRFNSTYFTPAESKDKHRVVIGCTAFSFGCHMQFMHGNFHVDVDIDGYDIPIYQKILESIQHELDNYILSSS